MAQVYLQRPSSSPSRAFSPERPTSGYRDMGDSLYIFPSFPAHLNQTIATQSRQRADSISDSIDLPSPSELSDSPIALSDGRSLLFTSDEDEESSPWERVSRASRPTSFIGGGIISNRPPRQPLARPASLSPFRTKSPSGIHPTPHPKFHIPLLSFFLSFLSIDETVLRLLSHNSSSSVLFPSTLLLDESLDSSLLIDDEKSHGVEKLVCRPKETDLLKAAVTFQADLSQSLADNEHFEPPPHHL